MMLSKEEKELLRKDLCARLPYGVKAKVLNEDILRYDYSSKEGGFIKGIENINDGLFVIKCRKDGYVLSYDEFKPYLLPLSSMTEEEAKELSILYGIKDILSINITDKYIDFKVDDGLDSIERKTIWYNEIISSTETFDWLNKNHFDYRGLIEKGLAIDATGLNIYC